MQDTRPLLLESDFPHLDRAGVQTLQVNLGYICNLSCVHCHVNAGPNRTESMARETVEQVLALVTREGVELLDLTGGAPELNPHFRYLVESARSLGVRVMDRCNLTVLFESGQEDLADFLARQQVEITASLPCYLEDNVEQQRGKGVYADSIRAIRLLNDLGYGRDAKLRLNLVYNPGGAFLPPAQATLEDAYRRELRERFAVEFSHLLTITNMPMGRFLSDLQQTGEAEDYQHLLQDSFNRSTIDGLMCRHQICIAWDGTLSDCDFNSVLGLSLAGGLPNHIDELDPAVLEGRAIVTGEHCFGCTAGCGSSCAGALVA